MHKVDVKRVQAVATISNPEPGWEVIVTFENEDEVAIPLPANMMRCDHADPRSAVEAIEALGKALLGFAAMLRQCGNLQERG